MGNNENASESANLSAPAVVVLAAGKGTRMKSELPKVLHPVMGRPIITHVLNAARYLSPARLIVVTGYKSEQVEAEISSFGPTFVRQDNPKGTGQAVQCATKALEGHDGPVVILPGDVPLISPQTLIDFCDAHQALGVLLSVLTVRVADPSGYGRIVRDQKGWLERIVEHRDADETELAIDEINSGFYIADGSVLREAIFDLKPNNAQNEYYLTDVVAEFRARGHLAAAIQGPDPLEVQGINDRRELALAQSILRRRINDSWLLFGVTMDDPATTYIESSVKLSKDVSLGPGVMLTGSTKVGPGTVIGPYCRLRNVEVEQGISLGAHLDLADLKLTSDGQEEPIVAAPADGQLDRVQSPSPSETKAKENIRSKEKSQTASAKTTSTKSTSVKTRPTKATSTKATSVKTTVANDN
ncbi:MAG: NTP transferase domain-containing protein [Deltaproteobacteria bacterium]|nr:NTP transferase domain-containing protein [Deltaproteobacteria bacterium]